MSNIIIILLLVIIITIVSIYIFKEKRKGNTCIGCPYNKECKMHNCEQSE